MSEELYLGQSKRCSLNICNLNNKAIAMMRGKSSLSEYILENFKSSNSLAFVENFEKQII